MSTGNHHARKLGTSIRSVKKRGERGGSGPAVEYRKYLNEGLNRGVDANVQPLPERVYGSEDFLKRMLALAARSDTETKHRRTRKAKPLSIDQILKAVAEHLAVFLCPCYRGVTLRELSSRFGLSLPDGSANLVRRTKAFLRHDLVFEESEHAVYFLSIRNDLYVDPQAESPEIP